MAVRVLLLGSLLLLAAACGEGGPEVPPDGGAAVDAAGDAAAADGSGDTARDGSARDGGADAALPADAEPGDAGADQATRPDEPPPGYYVAEQPTGCQLVELTLRPDGTFESDGSLPCDHPIPVGGRYAFEHLVVGSYLELRDMRLGEQYPDFGTKRYAYRLEAELLWLRDSAGGEWFSLRRVADGPPAP